MTCVFLRKCPFCNGEPSFKDTRACYGHGDYADETFLVCDSCGARTQAVSDHDHPSRDDRIIKVSFLWNRRFTGG